MREFQKLTTEEFLEYMLFRKASRWPLIRTGKIGSDVEPFSLPELHVCSLRLLLAEMNLLAGSPFDILSGR